MGKLPTYDEEMESYKEQARAAGKVVRYVGSVDVPTTQDDIATEISKMPQVYQGAYITISAARSSASHEGFLHDIRVPSARANITKIRPGVTSPLRC
jgi:hypothetical protein